MKNLEALNKDIEEYYHFKGHRDELNKRLDDLNERIKKRLISYNSNDNKENVSYYGAAGYQVDLKVKKKHTIDKFAAESLFWKKNLYDAYADTYLPEHAIEEAFLSGDITDSELRELRDTHYNLSLHVNRLVNRV